MAPDGESGRDDCRRKDRVLRLNPGNAMNRALFLFLLIPFLAAQTATEVEITSEPSHHLALENEFIRVFKVEGCAPCFDAHAPPSPRLRLRHTLRCSGL